MNFVYTSTNGTGTGQIMISIETVDKVPVANAFLLEAQKPGTYGERITLEASRDPDCHPQQGKSYLLFLSKKSQKKNHFSNDRTM